MRKIPAALAILGLAAVGLAGCSLPAASDCPRPDGSGEDLDLIQVTGSTDAAPEVDLYTPFNPPVTQFTDLEEGDGEIPITSDGQLVVLDLSLYSGDSGEPLVASGYDGDLSQPIPMSQWVATVPALEQALHCASDGARVVVAIPPDGIEASAATSVGLSEGESAVAVVDVRKVYRGAADGTLVYNSGMGLPAVVRAPDGTPGVVVPDGAAPDELVTQTLIKGHGPVVEEDSTVRLHVLSVGWDDKEQISSTWETGAPQSQSVTGQQLLQDVLVGQTVGSQVMAVVPAELGGTEQATVFVFDILGLDEAAPAP
ncbi:FKBP-type peptidyl-prolyl cis-trans isomerase [Microbacterium insulae]|uniref:FKBP-type peptidyl-prolyl cis-trans isomerase n=1 Tax=Microbacterium insulae TaxID=483014 RepID=A0ABW3ALH0_9MICO